MQPGSIGGAGQYVGRADRLDTSTAIDQCPDPLPDAGAAGVTSRTTAVGCAAGTEVEFVRVDGGGHIWTPDASWMSGQFFAAHGR